MVMKIIILTALFVSAMFLTGCVTKTTYDSNSLDRIYIYSDNDYLYSNRVDYLGYGLGGQGLGGYGMGGYGIAGYFPGS